MKGIGIIIGLFLLGALPALAADGDSAYSLQGGGPQPGQYHMIPWFLCDTKVAADEGSSCTEFDLSLAGMPEKLRIEISSTTACTGAYSVDIDTSTISGGASHDFVTLNAGTSAASAGPSVAIGRFITATVTGLANCTNLDVILWTYTRIKP